MTRSWVRLCHGLVAALLAVPAVTAQDLAAANDAEVLLEVAEAQLSLIQNTFIAAPIAGVIASVDVKEGDRVDVGKALVRLRDDQAKTELLAAQSAYEAARLESANDIDQRYAERTLQVRKRELQLSQKANQDYEGTVSETEIEKQKLVVDQSELAIEQAAHQQLVASATAAEKQAVVQMAKALLDRHKITAPVAGTVTQIDVQAGEWVEAGKPVARIISLDPLRAECFIDGRVHGSELVGHVVRFQPAAAASAPSAGVVGHVDFVSPELHPVTGQVRLWATLPNPGQKIRPGMQGKLVVLSEKITNSELQASPATALPAKKRIARKRAQ